MIVDLFSSMSDVHDLLDLINCIDDTSNGFTLVLSSGTTSDIVKPQDSSLSSDERNYNFAGFKKRNVLLQVTNKQLKYFSSSFTDLQKKRKRYRKFYIRKKSGNLREINAPVYVLNRIQRRIKAILSEIYVPQDCIHGFCKKRDIKTNASIHVGKNYVLNIDIKDFFPSIKFRTVKNALESLPFGLSGEREPLAFIIANLCCENGCLPQGAPTSPILTNIVCRRLDSRMTELAAKFGADYSRYADDITFSCNDPVFRRRYLDSVRKILRDEGFEINDSKTRLQGKGYRQEVTGLVVNEKLNISRIQKRKFRTLNHLLHVGRVDEAFDFYLKKFNSKIIRGTFVESAEKRKLLARVIQGFDAYSKRITDKGLESGVLLFREPYGNSIDPEILDSMEQQIVEAAITEIVLGDGFDSHTKFLSKTRYSFKYLLDVWESGGFDKVVIIMSSQSNE